MTKDINLDDSGQTADAGAAFPSLQDIRALGYSAGVYHYLSPETGEIVSLKPQEHQEAQLLQLRRLDWWGQHYYVAGSKQAFDVTKARSELMQSCHNAGAFRVDRIRGRGVWLDDDRVVYHGGDMVQVGDKGFRPHTFESANIYEAAPPWPGLGRQALDVRGASMLLDLLELMPWRRGLDARLVAGWLAIAPLCGAMKWRPHLYLTGESGSGKSWLMDTVFRKVLGPMSLAIEGDSTEAGIRQTLGADARPILYDEAEPESGAGHARLAKILRLARRLSDDSGGAILKGSAGHEARSFEGRAILAIAGVAVALDKQADRSRFTVFDLEATTDFETRRQTMALTSDLAFALDDAWRDAFHRRMIDLLPVIRHNHQLFAEALDQALGSRRIGMQLGGMMAGWHALTSGEKLTLADAVALVACDDWRPYDEVTGDSDQQGLLSRLYGMTIMVEADGGRRRMRWTVGDCLWRLYKRFDDDQVRTSDFDRAIRQIGLRVVHHEGQDMVAVASRHAGLAALLAQTDFAQGWSRVLERLPGAIKHPHSVRFSPGVQSRAVFLPMTEFAEGPRYGGVSDEDSRRDEGATNA